MSDANTPEQVGIADDTAVELLVALGVSKLCVFEQRVRRLDPIGPS